MTTERSAIPTEPAPPTDARQVVYVQPAFGPPYEEDEIDLLDLWRVIWSGRRLIAGVTFLATAAAVLVSLYVLPVILTRLTPRTWRFSASHGIGSSRFSS